MTNTTTTPSAAVLGCAKHRNDSRYRGSGRHWATPPELFAKLNIEFNFDLDPCATSKSAKCAKFYDEAADGLAKDWGASTVFMNPPYGKEIRAWIKKAVEASRGGALVVGLLPAETDSDWFHDHILANKAEVRFLRKRPRFLVYMEDGSVKWASPFRPSIVVVWRPTSHETNR